MAYAFDHVHVKAPDPGKTAEWFSKAFGFTVARDSVRDSGDRFIVCKTADGITVNISGAKLGDQLGPGDAQTHWGLEHFGMTVDSVDAEIERLAGMGAELLDGPLDAGGGLRIAFLKGPDDVRLEILQTGG